MVLQVLKTSHYYSSTPEGGAHAPSPPLQSLHPLTFTTTQVNPDVEIHTRVGYQKMEAQLGSYCR